MNQQNTSISLRVLETRFWPNDDEPKFQVTGYLASQSDLIEKGIVPPDFFNFRGRERRCHASWYGKKIPSKHVFPEDVRSIRIKKRAGGLWFAEIWHVLNKPPYIPPGEEMPQPEPARQPTRKESRYGINADDTSHAAPRIGTGVWELNDFFGVAYRGTQEQLIGAGLATAAMFPKGKTPTGRPRSEKRCWKGEKVHWLVSQETDGTFTVRYYNVLPVLEMEDYSNLLKSIWSARRRDDDEDNEDEDYDD